MAVAAATLDDWSATKDRKTELGPTLQQVMEQLQDLKADVRLIGSGAVGGRRATGKEQAES